MAQRMEIRACPHCRTPNRLLLTKRALSSARCGRCRQPLRLTYYDLLGVSRFAASDEIKRAYRALAARWHPDRNRDRDAAEVFVQLTEAYQTLVHPERRRQYDATLPPAPAQAACRARDSSGQERSALWVDDGLAAELVRFMWLSTLALAGVVFWAIHHAEYPGLSASLLVASLCVGLYGILSLLYFVATGKRLSLSRAQWDG